MLVVLLVLDHVQHLSTLELLLFPQIWRWLTICALQLMLLGDASVRVVEKDASDGPDAPTQLVELGLKGLLHGAFELSSPLISILDRKAELPVDLYVEQFHTHRVANLVTSIFSALEALAARYLTDVNEALDERHVILVSTTLSSAVVVVVVYSLLL